MICIKKNRSKNDKIFGSFRFFALFLINNQSKKVLLLQKINNFEKDLDMKMGSISHL